MGYDNVNTFVVNFLSNRGKVAQRTIVGGVLLAAVFVGFVIGRIL